MVIKSSDILRKCSKNLFMTKFWKRGWETWDSVYFLQASNSTEWLVPLYTTTERVVKLVIIYMYIPRICDHFGRVQNDSNNSLINTLDSFNIRSHWVQKCGISSVSNGDITVFLNTLRPRENGRHFADDIFKCIFLNENVWIPVKISLKFVPKSPINNIPTLI